MSTVVSSAPGVPVQVRLTRGALHGRSCIIEAVPYPDGRLGALPGFIVFPADEGLVPSLVYSYVAGSADGNHVYEYQPDGQRSVVTARRPPPEPLDEDLVEYLDWPLYFPDDSVGCNQAACPHHDRDEEGYIASGRRLTVREFLADIKAHAEEAAP
jgi:hypothetical protein